MSFYTLWEQMQKSAPMPLMGSGDDTQAMVAIRAGKNLRKDDDRPFWDDFMDLCANRNGLAELLGVTPEEIADWPVRIKDMLEEIEKHDAQNPSVEEKQKVMPTGQNGAVTTTNIDPNVV